MIQAHQGNLLSASEAADLLGITPRRVYALVRGGRLHATRIGRHLLLDRDAVDARAAGDPAVGRPFSPRRAWVLILLAAGLPTPGVDPSTLSKMRGQLREQDLWSMRSKLVDRAERRQLRAHSSDIARLEAELDTIRTGARCAAEAGLGLLAPDAPLELYVDRGAADRLVERYRLAPSQRPNVILRVLTDEVRGWLGGTLAPYSAIALDVAEELDARAQDVARLALARP